MIEINLLPGSAKRQKRNLPKLSAGPLARMAPPRFDRSLALVVGGWVIALAAIAWMHFGTSSQQAQLELDAEAAARDSARLFTLRQINDSLHAKQDTISAKLEIIQTIDAGRYTWAHIMDEIARALPPYTWVVNLADAVTEGPLPRFRIEGRTGNTFALTKFMQDLEASPFLRNIAIISQQQTPNSDKIVYSFVLEGAFEEPPPDAIRTEPLFGEAFEQPARDSAAPAVTGAAGEED